MELKSLADRCRVANNLPSAMTGYTDKDGDYVMFKVFGPNLIKFVNDVKMVGDGKKDRTGRVTALKVRKSNAGYDVRDQFGWGSDDFPVATVKTLELLSHCCNVRWK